MISLQIVNIILFCIDSESQKTLLKGEKKNGSLSPASHQFHPLKGKFSSGTEGALASKFNYNFEEKNNYQK